MFVAVVASVALALAEVLARERGLVLEAAMAK